MTIIGTLPVTLTNGALNRPARFFIAGLPRSRTAWLAAFLSTGSSICYHDPSVRMSKLEDIGSLYDAHGYTHVGISDSALSFWADTIVEMYEPRTLIVGRDVSEVIASLRAINCPGEELCDEATVRLSALRGHPLVKWVPFHALSVERVVELVWFHLLPGVPFDVARWREFDKLNIQTKFQTQAKLKVAHEEAPDTAG